MPAKFDSTRPTTFVISPAGAIGTGALETICSTISVLRPGPSPCQVEMIVVCPAFSSELRGLAAARSVAASRPLATRESGHSFTAMVGQEVADGESANSCLGTAL